MLVPAMIQIPFEVWGAIFCIMCGLIVHFSRKDEMKRSKVLASALFIEAVQLIFDAIAIGFRGNVSTLGFWAVRISNFLVFTTNYLMGILLVLYITETIKDISKKQKRYWNIPVMALGTIGLSLLILSQFTNFLYYFDDNNIYHRSNLSIVNMAIPFFMIVLSAIMLVRFRNHISKINFYALLTYIFLPLSMSVVQFFVYGISLTNMANSITMLLIFVVHEVDKSTRLVSKEKEVAKNKIELSDTKVSLMMSKIHPHFISNTLLTIQGLYHEDIDKGDKIMNTFISYLQQSFSNISVNEPVDFSLDLEHAMHYSDISLARWPDMTIEYNIKCKDFKIPYLTLQPMIENAVRHGLMPLEEGGKVTISTYDDDNYYYVSIIDNGVGFDVNNPVSKQFKNDRAHIGVSNVRDRLKVMSNGTLEISSKIGEGTSVIIKLPKEEE